MINIYQEHPEWFHELANTIKHNPSQNTINLALEYLISYQCEIDKTEVIVGEEIFVDKFGLKVRQPKIIKRTIRFDSTEREFYIYYDGLKYYVKPVREPLNQEDMNLYKWTI